MERKVLGGDQGVKEQSPANSPGILGGGGSRLWEEGEFFPLFPFLCGFVLVLILVCFASLMEGIEFDCLCVYSIWVL